MKTYLDYKIQIQGFGDVLDTAKSSEKIAASAVHFLKAKVYSLDQYTETLDKLLSRLILFYQKREHPLLEKKENGKKVLLLITADKGLVGGLWHQLISAFLNKKNNYDSVIVVGSKGGAYLEEEGAKIIKSFEDFSDLPETVELQEIAAYLFKRFKGAEFSKVDILYSQFVSLAEQKPVFCSFLPFDFKIEKKTGGVGFPIFEPSNNRIFDGLLQKYVNLYFYKIVLEAKLSEFSARTVSMEHASEKTKELIAQLKASYRKERHRVITQRQLESFRAHKVI